MAMANPADLIRARLSQIDAQLSDMDATGRLLRGERHDLVTTLMVLERFGGDDGVAFPEPDLEARRVSDAPSDTRPEIAARAKADTTKPPGTPTVPEMIVEVLLRPHLLGYPGLEPKDITAKIRERWWPDAPSQSIGPIVWRMWKKDKRLVRDGALYALPPDEPRRDSVGAFHGGLFEGAAG